jgi:subtilase family serine protease
MSGNVHAQLVPMTGTVPPNLSDIEGPGPAPPTMPLKMEIYFKVRNKQLFDARADPDSPEYMRKMSIEEEDAVFGPLRSDIDVVSSWLTSEGFRVGIVSGHVLVYVQFTGTVEQTEKVFHISIISSPDGNNFANTQEPLIPARFADVILAISGLSNLGGMGHSVDRSP